MGNSSRNGYVVRAVQARPLSSQHGAAVSSAPQWATLIPPQMWASCDGVDLGSQTSYVVLESRQ